MGIPCMPRGAQTTSSIHTEPQAGCAYWGIPNGVDYHGVLSVQVTNEYGHTFDFTLVSDAEPLVVRNLPFEPGPDRVGHPGGRFVDGGLHRRRCRGGERGWILVDPRAADVAVRGPGRDPHPLQCRSRGGHLDGRQCQPQCGRHGRLVLGSQQRGHHRTAVADTRSR